MQEIEFDNVWGITAGYGNDKDIIIRETDDSDAKSFSGKVWEVSVILTRKPDSYVPGWYMDKWDLDHPETTNFNNMAIGNQASLTYYSQAEIDEGEVPDDDMIRVQVVPYPEP